MYSLFCKPCIIPCISIYKYIKVFIIKQLYLYEMYYFLVLKQNKTEFNYIFCICIISMITQLHKIKGCIKLFDLVIGNLRLTKKDYVEQLVLT